MATLYTSPSRWVIACAFCQEPIENSADAVHLGDLGFHARCTPRCDACGRSLGAELEVDWSFQVMVVPSVYGYERVPFHHLCPECRTTALLGEPAAQD